ncbi:MAG TPA: hypothetical protein VGC74_17160 [Stenotrophomonas sp.]|jgi:hypothetical protein
MSMRNLPSLLLFLGGLGLFASVLAACHHDGPNASPVNSGPAGAATPARPAAAVAEARFTWPASLRPFGEGYRQPGDPCKRLGESGAVANHLDHTRDLVGCPGTAQSPDAQSLMAERGAKVVELIDGVTVLTVKPQ